jgi:hypothetical protein
MGAISKRHGLMLLGFSRLPKDFSVAAPLVPVSFVAISAYLAKSLQHRNTTFGNVVALGTVTERVRQDGSKAYMAQISIIREGRHVLRENKTFDRKPAARAWIDKREAELAKPGAIAAARAAPAAATLADAIKMYVTTSKRPLGKTKIQVLKSIRRMKIAKRECADITSQDIIAFATKLGEEMKPEEAGRDPEPQRTPQTVGNYMSHLAAVFAIARPAWGYLLDQRAMDDATKVARRLGLSPNQRSETAALPFKSLTRC